jgi:hypothetical protein
MHKKRMSQDLINFVAHSEQAKEHKRTKVIRHVTENLGIFHVGVLLHIPLYLESSTVFVSWWEFCKSTNRSQKTEWYIIMKRNDATVIVSSVMDGLI